MKKEFHWFIKQNKTRALFTKKCELSGKYEICKIGINLIKVGPFTLPFVICLHDLHSKFDRSAHRIILDYGIPNLKQLKFNMHNELNAR